MLCNGMQRESTIKKKQLENILYQKEISVCCIQETHIQESKQFKIQGYQCCSG
uniref:Endonuclease/exonuclease/phosphatase domain-containing protein n=1 Tax=Arion vulgaris TaxID=1028688 RepID=A0A0B7BXN0_9EUPU